MKAKSAPYILLIIMGLVALLVIQYRKSARQPVPKPPKVEVADPPRNEPSAPPSDVRGRDQGLIRNPTALKFSKHARCRMDCRHIDESEIREVLTTGTLNLAKTELRGQPDPKYAVEGKTHDGQLVRLVVAQSPRGSVVVTVIDLNKKWTCHCPGD